MRNLGSTDVLWYGTSTILGLSGKCMDVTSGEVQLYLKVQFM
jgi:hypothetical protein